MLIETQNPSISSDIFQQIPLRVLTSLITAAVLFLLSLLSKSIRVWIFYKRHEYALEYDSDFDGCEWDIQWEGFRLTISVGDVHNQYLKDVTLKIQGEDPGYGFTELRVSRELHGIPNRPLYFKLNSILRTKSHDEVDEYIVYFVILRRRW